MLDRPPEKSAKPSKKIAAALLCVRLQREDNSPITPFSSNGEKATHFFRLFLRSFRAFASCKQKTADSRMRFFLAGN